jgi:hypothetical protein
MTASSGNSLETIHSQRMPRAKPFQTLLTSQEINTSSDQIVHATTFMNTNGLMHPFLSQPLLLQPLTFLDHVHPALDAKLTEASLLPPEFLS